MSSPPAPGGRLSPLVYLADNWISRIGILLTTTGGVAWLFTLPAFLGAGHPYLDLLTVFGLPAIFFLGLLLIPIGIRLKHARKLKAGEMPETFPPLAWSNVEFRKLASFVGLATFANIIIGGHLTYSAVEYMDSSNFCGQACHIMEPEWTAYQYAPHSEVGCTECHIGSGAVNYVEAKLNGAKQLIQVMTNTYPTPVPTPVHNLAQGDLTCGECHSGRDLGSKRKEWIRFASDEINSATRTELLLLIGGGRNFSGAHGAHLAGDARLEYRSSEDRLDIPWVRYVSPEGEETVYAEAGWSEAGDGEHELREMNCTDCHNRAAHSFERASLAVDEALVEGRIDPDLPFIKREAMAALETAYPSREAAAAGIPAHISEFYAGRGGGRDPQVVAQAGEAVAAIYARNIFPEFGVDWETHPNLSGHEPGCFRCHNDDLLAQDAERLPVGDDCAVCHLVLAEDQPVSAPEGAPLRLTSGGGASRIGTLIFETAAGPAPFDHAEHVDYAEGECRACHNQLFPMSRAPLGYGAELHRAAEAAETSCAGCHVSGGSAFASEGNCTRCHTGLSEPRTLMARGPTGPSPLPQEIAYETDLGQAQFDHAEHIEHAEGDCRSCHNQLFPMESGIDLEYGGEDFHRTAEAAGSSCAGCHVEGGTAFAAAGNCQECHAGLGTPRPTPTTGRSGVPDLPEIDTRLGEARFDHSRHVELAEGDCQSCHNQIFPLSKGLLNYADDLHRTAEEAGTSCGACHRPGGEAFASEGHCLDCHADASTQETGSALGLPESLLYPNELGRVRFNHDEHIRDAQGECKACHNELFPMEKANGLARYAEDYHREAERSQTSCASCHRETGDAFGTLDNCTRCHEGLELERRASVLGGLTTGIGPAATFLLLLLCMPSTLVGQLRGYIGSERCGVCHEEELEGFSGNPHTAEDTQFLCESCHGPGLPHVQALDPAPLAVFAAAQPDRVNQACLECHDSDPGQSGVFFSAHLRNDVACTGCHQVHAPEARPLLAKTSNNLCADCHAGVSLAFNRPFRHKLHQGAIDCVDCHDPHGSPGRQMARVFATERSCLSCHADKAGPFPFEHAPVKLETCTTCHEPHGSSNPRMLTRHNVAQLCLECHTTSMATLGGTPPAFHDLRSARFRECTTCHSKIHGSFVSRDFLR